MEQVGNTGRNTRPNADYSVIKKQDGECWSIDEKMGQTYIHYEQANTLAARDYKQPQAVIYGIDRNDSRPSNTKDK